MWFHPYIANRSMTHMFRFFLNEFYQVLFSLSIRYISVFLHFVSLSPDSIQ